MRVMIAALPRVADLNGRSPGPHHTSCARDFGSAWCASLRRAGFRAHASGVDTEDPSI
jgi:hypothetical protein